MSEYDEKTDEALDVVAVRYATQLLKTRADEDDHEDYPELGMYDFMEVVERVKKLADQAGPTDEEYAAAYKHLASRAKGVPA